MRCVNVNNNDNHFYDDELYPKETPRTQRTPTTLQIILDLLLGNSPQGSGITANITNTVRTSKSR